MTELWEVDEAIPGDLVGQVDDLLLHRVQAEHLHGGVKVLRKGVSDKDGSSLGGRDRVLMKRLE